MKLNEPGAIIIAALITGIVSVLIAGYFQLRQTQIPIEATQTAEAKLTIDLGSNTFEPSNLSPPTNTPNIVKLSSTPTPTSIPTSTPTPDPRLFVDDFETGIKPEWGMSGDGFSATNGNLTLGVKGLMESQIIGDNSWQNYSITFSEFYLGLANTLRVLVRVQDRDNYMAFECHDRGAYASIDCYWYKTIDGQSEPVAGAEVNIGSLRKEDKLNDLKLEVQDNTYRTFFFGKQRIYFSDDSFSDGGFKLEGNAPNKWDSYIQIGSVEVSTLP